MEPDRPKKTKSTKGSPFLKKKRTPLLNQPARSIPHGREDNLANQIIGKKLLLRNQSKKEKERPMEQIISERYQPAQWEMDDLTLGLQKSLNPHQLDSGYRGQGFTSQRQIHQRRIYLKERNTFASDQPAFTKQKIEMHEQQLRRREEPDYEGQQEFCIIPALQYDRLCSDVSLYEEFIKRNQCEQQYFLYYVSIFKGKELQQRKEDVQCHRDNEENQKQQEEIQVEKVKQIKEVKKQKPAQDKSVKQFEKKEETKKKKAKDNKEKEQTKKIKEKKEVLKDQEDEQIQKVYEIQPFEGLKKKTEFPRQLINTERDPYQSQPKRQRARQLYFTKRQAQEFIDKQKQLMLSPKQNPQIAQLKKETERKHSPKKVEKVKSSRKNEQKP